MAATSRQSIDEPKVLVVTRWFPSDEAPSQGTFVRDWALVSARLSRVRVLHLAAGAVPLDLERIEDPELEVYRLVVAARGVQAPISHVRDLLQARRSIAYLHADEPIDLIHAHAYPAATPSRLGARKIGVPYIVTEHFSRLIRGDIRWFHSTEARFAFAKAATLMAVGPALASSVESLTHLPAQAVPNPVPGNFTLAEPPEPGPPFRVLTVASLRRIKGLDVGLEALALLSRSLDVRWRIVGEGDDRGQLLEHAGRLGLADRVEFVGRASRMEVHQHMASSHAVMVPSRTETFSVVAAEALMTGRPVVATRSGGPEAFVGTAEGRIVDPEEPEQLADALADVLLHPDSFRPESVASRAQRTFSEDAVATRLAEVYEAVLSEQ